MVMLKYAIPFVLLWLGCESVTPIEGRKMTVAPDSLYFDIGDTVKTLSITHNCACPFSWEGQPSIADSSGNLSPDGSGILKAFSGKDDNTSLQVFIDTSKAPNAVASSDTIIERYWLVKAGESFGEASVKVIIRK